MSGSIPNGAGTMVLRSFAFLPPCHRVDESKSFGIQRCNVVLACMTDQQ